MTHPQTLMGIFAYADDVVRAIENLRKAGIVVNTVYSPARNEEIDEALALKPSPVRLFVLCGAVAGLLSGYGLSVYTASQWHFVVWGKPPVPFVPYVIISFEFCILFAVLFGLAGLLILARMPRLRIPGHFDARFTVDRYGMVIACPAERVAAVRRMLQENGAEEVHGD